MKLIPFFTSISLVSGSLFFHQCYQGTVHETDHNETGRASLQNCYALQNECTWRYTHCLNGTSVYKRVEYGCSSALWGNCQQELGSSRNKTIACKTYESTVNGTIVNAMFCCCGKAACNGEQMEKYQIVEDFLDLLPEPMFDEDDLTTDSAVCNGSLMVVAMLTLFTVLY